MRGLSVWKKFPLIASITKKICCYLHSIVIYVLLLHILLLHKDATMSGGSIVELHCLIIDSISVSHVVR